MKKITQKTTEERQKEAWFDAVYAKDIKTIKRMIKEGFDINITTVPNVWAALHYACLNRNYDIVKLLIDNGADVNSQDNDGWTPLHVACVKADIQVVKFLIEHDADVTLKDESNNYTPFNYFKKKYPQKCEKLMQWLSEEYPDKALEVMASDNIQGKGVGL